MKNIISLLVLLSLSVSSFPQQQTNWQNFADMKTIRNIAATSDGFWAATKGGAFFYNNSESSYKTFSKVEGLNGIDLTATAIDKDGKVWFGSSNGMFDVYSPQDNSFKSILDIYTNQEHTNKSINDFAVAGDTIFAATDFGISLINPKTYLFFDTFSKFGSFTSFIKVKSIIVKDLIYAATESGIAIQKPGTTNLSAPESWNVYTNLQGLPQAGINKIIFYNEKLIAGTNLGLYEFNRTTWQTFLTLTNNKIIDLQVNGNLLYILTPTLVYLYDGSTLQSMVTLNVTPTKINYSSNNGLLVASNIGVIKDSLKIYPNGPAANQFPYMTFDKSGNLWSSSGKDVSGVGLYKYGGSNWEVYNVAAYPDLFSNAYYSVYCASDNSIYAGMWGQGFVKIKDNNIQRFHAGNSPMIGIPGSPNFVVISSLAEDSKNNIWALNLRAADKKSLYMLTPDSIWYSFENVSESQGDFSEVKNLVIDPNGTKWYYMATAGNIGLYYFNDKGTYDNTNDDVYGYVSKTKGLSTNDVFSLAIDRRGDLWVGSGLGVNIISNVDAVLNSTNPQLKITNSFSVRQQTINAIAVDPLNQKWLGTNQGLFLLSSDGTQLLASLDTKNSPLLSDIIESLAFDESTGKLYVGTASGLTSFETPSIIPVDNFNGLNIYPNPLVITDGSKLVTIDGLIRDTDIKIVSVSGKLVREFSSAGGRVAFWDGRDDNGDFVNSGVYIVIAFDQEGNSVETGKIAVLRE